MNTWSLALRNVWRNTRRTSVTMMAIALSCAGLMLFGGYISWAHLASEVHTVMISGHLQLFKEGFLEKGSGNPAGYAISNYDELRDLLLLDPVLASKLDLVTGQLIVQGIVNNSAKKTSATFAGFGCFASDIERIIRWNPYDLTEARDLAANSHLFAAKPELDDTDPEGITLGEGLARVLEVKPDELKAKERPSVELMSLPPAGGLPNMVSGTVRQTSIRALEQIDNHLVVMPIKLANELVFPGEPLHVTSLQILLKRTADIPAVQQRIAELNASHQLGIEQRTCTELNPNNVRSLGMMDMFFVFAFCIVSVVLVFTIYNTMMMGIVERTREIGAIRAMGVTRGGIVTMFVQEGIVIGLIGGTLGVALGLFAAWCINHAMILYTPPYVNVQAKLEVFCARPPTIIIASFLSCFFIALIASFFPARRASRMGIAEALRH
ncbi:MAG: ABC transporter permease [Verrucomicrobiaceae bacterium]|nr:ABC transporter permease [Verrucomicrobiaceae bacterium]